MHRCAEFYAKESLLSFATVYSVRFFFIPFISHIRSIQCCPYIHHGGARVHMCGQFNLYATDSFRTQINGLEAVAVRLCRLNLQIYCCHY